MPTSKPTKRNGSTEVQCLNCQKPFSAYNSTIKRGYAKFCSVACKYPYMKAHRMFQPDGRSASTCNHCGAIFEGQTWSVKNRRKYCTKECSEKAAKRRGTAQDNRLTLKCIWCKTTYKKRPSQYADGRSKFCSRQCRGAWIARYKQNRVSEVETRFLDLVEAAGLPLTRQVKVRHFVIDAVAKETNLAIEFDGEYWHSLPRMVEKDARKTTAIAFAGLKLVRIPERLFIDDPDAAVRLVLQAAREI
jgi:very-short-patch-repair endonuclease